MATNISSVIIFFNVLLQGKQINSHETMPTNGRQHTITINDTPSPAVSVITISDSEDEEKPEKKVINNHAAPQNQANTQQVHRKNVISCVTVPDSDTEDHRSPAKNQAHYQQVIKNEPTHHNTNHNYGSQSRKTRLLAKAQSECMLNVPTKQEPGVEYHQQQHRSNDYLVPQQNSHCSSSCKEILQPYQYVNAGSNHANMQDQHVIYSNSEKRVSWAPPAAHNTNSHGSSRRHSAVVNLRDYNIPSQNHKEYIQPPAAHSTRDALNLGRDQHLLAPTKNWGPQQIHPSYR